jgi:hypothetical protein
MVSSLPSLTQINRELRHTRLGLNLIFTPIHADKGLPFTSLVCAPVLRHKRLLYPLLDDRKYALTNSEFRGVDTFNPVI